MRRSANALSVATPPVKHGRDRFVAFAFASADVLVELDNEHRILYIDGATTGYLGANTKKLIGKDFSSLALEEDIPKLLYALGQIEKHGRVNQCKIHLQTKVYQSLPVMLSGLKLPSHDNHIYLTLTVLTQEMSVEELNERDAKSGLFQKQDFARKAQQKIKKAREEGKDTRISLVDLPGLQALLDGLPSESASDLILQIADYLRSKSLDGDSAGLVGEGVYSLVHDAALTTEQMIREVRAITQHADPEGLGIAPNIQSVQAEATGLNDHDMASAILYTLNRFAQNPSSFNLASVQQGYQAMLNETMEKISSFKKTVATENFQIAYQPIVDLKNGIVHHYETLVRFDSDKFSNPFQFITFGEQTDLISDFDLAMCQRSINVLEEKALQQQYPSISVNLSGRSLSSTLFMDAILNMVKQAHPLRKQIIFEITESAKIDDLGSTNRFIQKLRSEGHQCCLDDFGVAESSFDYLRHLFVDFIKIDGSYVKDSITSPRGRSMLRAMVGMCRGLSMQTIGEMIEDTETAEILWDSGVHFGQGYLFGKPNTDEAELLGCGKVSQNYVGILRAKRIRNNEEKDEWWKTKKE